MAEELKTNKTNIMPGKSKKGGGLEVGSAFQMKNSALKMSAKYGTPMQANYDSPMRHGVTDASGKKSYRGHSHKGMSLSQRLGLSKEPLKIEKDVRAVGKDLQSKASKVKTATEKVTNKITGDVNTAKSKIEKTTQKIGDKISSDIKTLRKTDIPKKFISDVRNLLSGKKKSSPATKKTTDPKKKKKATLNLDYIKKGFDKASQTNFSNAKANLEKARSKKTVVGGMPSAYVGATQFVGGMATEGASAIVKGVQNISKKVSKSIKSKITPRMTKAERKEFNKKFRPKFGAK